MKIVERLIVFTGGALVGAYVMQNKLYKAVTRAVLEGYKEKVEELLKDK